MAFYTVHLPPDATTPDGVAEKAVFVKEGFAIFGLAFGGFWLLFNKLWLHAIAFAAVYGLVFAGFQFFDLPKQAFGFITMLMGALVGLEGNEWLRRNHARKGWSHAGTVSGPNLAECERRFFKGWLDQQGQAVLVAQHAPATPNSFQTSSVPPSSVPQVLGLFPAAKDRS